MTDQRGNVLIVGKIIFKD